MMLTLVHWCFGLRGVIVVFPCQIPLAAWLQCLEFSFEKMEFVETVNVDYFYDKLCIVNDPTQYGKFTFSCRYAPPHPKATWPLSANILDPVRASVVCSGPSQIIQVQ